MRVGVQQKVMSLPQKASAPKAMPPFFLLSSLSLSLSLVRNEQGVPGEAGSLAGERGKRKRKRKENDSGGDITSWRTLYPAIR
ncbi:MAG: hypothetical protein LBC18_03725 [Opitutaceae bacterium]|jgi:hypothetical protein|nr:hypothetical protein [Opitutaceae bacterium]